MRIVLALLACAALAAGCGPTDGSDGRAAATLAAAPRIVDWTPPDTSVTDPAAQRRAEEMARGFTGAYLVAKGGKVLAAGAHGTADQVSGARNTLETSFRLASVSKPLTSIAVMQLYEQGKLDVQAPVRRYLPDWPNDELKVHHLLSHRTSLSDYVGLSIAPATSQELYERALRPRGPGRPSGFRYVNTNFALLGIIIEKVSGQSYEQYMAEHVFGKVHAQHSGLMFPEDATDGFAAPNGSSRGALGDSSLKAFSAGGLYASVVDLYWLNDALHSGVLLKPETVRLMLAPKDGGPYAYGWYAGDGFAHHDGVIGGFNSKIYSYPDTRGLVVVLSNEDDGAVGLARQLKSLLEE